MYFSVEASEGRLRNLQAHSRGINRSSEIDGDACHLAGPNLLSILRVKILYTAFHDPGVGLNTL